MTAGSSLAARRRRVADLVDLARPLTARSVLASTLLGAREPLPVAALVTAASLFGVSSGATRTCLWRMVSNGELVADNGSYSLAGHLLARRERIDDAARPADVRHEEWDGTWELAIVRPGGRAAADRLELRRSATALHLGELRDGVWTRPDNLAPARLPTLRAVIDEQCVQFRGATTALDGVAVWALFDLDRWSRVGRRLAAAMRAEVDAGPVDDGRIGELLTHRFLLSVAAIRHLQLDPHLPEALLLPDFPGDELRAAYRTHVQLLYRGLVQARTEASP